MMPKVESPCVRNCCLNDNDICMGCFRTLDEIKDWLSLSDAGKNQVLEQCESRRLQKQQKYDLSNQA